MSANAEGSEFSDFKHAYLSNIKYDDKNKIKTLTGAPGAAGQMASFFGRINYNYKEKYMATAIMRADGSSILPVVIDGDISRLSRQAGSLQTKVSCQISIGWIS